MSADLRELYQHVILEHSRAPRNRRAIEGAPRGEGHIPMCGDHVIVYVRLEDGVVSDVSFEGSGCTIAMASASLMTETVRGRALADVEALAARVTQMVTAPPGAPVAEDAGSLGAPVAEDAGSLGALAGVRQFPIRAKCATLAWQALRDACYSPPTSR